MSGLQLHAWFISSNTCSLFPHSLSLSLSRVATTPFYLFFHNPFSFASLILCFLSLSFYFLCYSDSFFSFISPSIYFFHSFISIPLHSVDTTLRGGSVFEKGGCDSCEVGVSVTAMAAPKPEEISHPPMDQLQGLEYCIDSNPSWGTLFLDLFFNLHSPIDDWLIFWMVSHFLDVKTAEAIALGFQHYILALGTAVMIPSFLVPLMGGTDVSQFSKPNHFSLWFGSITIQSTKAIFFKFHEVFEGHYCVETRLDDHQIIS